jgi:hypothetical protein
MALWQEGIRTAIMIDGHGTQLFDNEAQKRFDFFIEQTGMKIIKHTPNLSWLTKL